MNQLFCIKHQSMVLTEENQEAGIFGHEDVQAIEDYPFFDYDFCEFEQGWATCPPPESDFLETQEPDLSTMDDPDGLFPFWVYEPSTDTMVMEERVQ